MDSGGVLRALAAALAVLAALLAPALLAHTAQSPGLPMTQLADDVLPPEGPGARDWTAMDCRDDLCGVPIRLRLHGRQYDREAGVARSIDRTDPSTRTLTWRLREVGGPGRAVLVGALRSSSASDLEVRLGGQPAFEIPGGRLSLLEVPRGVTSVTLVERGRFSATQELRVQEYAERG